MESLKRSNYPIYITALVFYYLSFFIRGLRWRLFLKNAQIDKEISGPLPNVLICSQLVLLGWFANTISWFRMGDAYRSYLLRERCGASFPKTVGTILAEHAVDVLALMILLMVALAMVSGSSSVEGARYIIWAALLLGGVVILGLLFLRFASSRVIQLLPQRFKGVPLRFQQGVLGSLRQLPLVALLSAFIWVSESFRIFLVTQALGVGVAPAFILFVTLTHALLIIVPITPAGLGIVEAGMTGVLSLTVAPEQAVSIAILDRSITYASVIIVGLLIFLARYLSRAVKSLNRPARV